MASKALWNDSFQSRLTTETISADGCVMLLAAIVRQWWKDALYQPGACSPDNLETLAEFMDLPVRELTERQPVTYWRNRYDH